MSGTARGRATPAAQGRPIKFERPPVIETLLSAQFAPLPRLTSPHIGLYWAEIRDRYPNQEVKPPLVPAIEEFPAPPPGPRVGIELVAEPDVRCWFIDGTSTQLIQVQRDRFIRNWRKVAPTDDYPAYDALRPRFQEEWEIFLRFLEREELGRPEVSQCEVTYVNHIELGQGWNSFGEVAEVLAPLAPVTSREFLPQPEMLQLNVRYAMPGNKGRLHVTAQPAIRRHDAKEVLQLTLTARGKPDSSATRDVMTWFDLGHDWIVYGFVDLTTAKMHRIWRRL